MLLGMKEWWVEKPKLLSWQANPVWRKNVSCEGGWERAPLAGELRFPHTRAANLAGNVE
jgi:hypothetical protein